MIPNYSIKPIRLIDEVSIFGYQGPIEIQYFGICVALAVLVGAHFVSRHAKHIGLNPVVTQDALTWMLLSAFFGAHLFDVLVYEPHKILKDPWVLIKFWDGIASTGGYLGAFIGLSAYIWKKRKLITSYAGYFDAMTMGLVVGWVFGRLGCTLVRDHLGIQTDFFAAFMDASNTPRHNLALYEMMFSISFIPLFFWIAKKSPPKGLLTGLYLFLYGVIRFPLDFLRLETTDPRYAGLTGGQYIVLVMGLGGLVFLLMTLRKQRTE